MLNWLKKLLGGNMSSLVVSEGPVWFAGQPTAEEIRDWGGNGVVLIVNSRTPEEMAGLGFDEAEVSEQAGIRYVELPIGGSHGADPQLTLMLAQLLEEVDGIVVMHCRSGMRSAHLYAAYLRHKNPDLADPFAEFGWPLGRDMALVDALTP